MRRWAAEFARESSSFETSTRISVVIVISPWSNKRSKVALNQRPFEGSVLLPSFTIQGIMWLAIRHSQFIFIVLIWFYRHLVSLLVWINTEKRDTNASSGALYPRQGKIFWWVPDYAALRKLRSCLIRSSIQSSSGIVKSLWRLNWERFSKPPETMLLSFQAHSSSMKAGTSVMFFRMDR